ncbi:hypothetical protein Ccrd_005451 [Cynara cardunculus var. scolymus]|uniref:Uncharacterized protein n=1 Tax=Cynara cardunculus var. scolymus TaxID=59895 RepID=A0A103XKL7_CYNCS|nr:hypothetical protein Ccrd_005451 [Cynara cardunculus var. scolymus]
MGLMLGLSPLGSHRVITCDEKKSSINTWLWIFYSTSKIWRIMKAGGGLVFGVPRAAVLPSLFVSRRRSITFRCYSSSSSDHVSFIKDIAVAQPPEHLHHLLKMLQVRGKTLMELWTAYLLNANHLSAILKSCYFHHFVTGESIISPAAKQGMIPLAIPLSKNSSGSVTALLRWPTAPPGMEMPVVEVRSYGVWLLAKNVSLLAYFRLHSKSWLNVVKHLKIERVDQYIHRILVEEDANSSTEGIDEVFNASGEAGEKLYTKGDFAKSRNSNLDVSAMVTGEFYTKKEHFPGFGRPFVFNAEEVADIAEWDDEQIEFIKEKVSEEVKQEDLKKGKEAAQISLDEAAFLLDLASIEGTWDEELERIAECYNEGGLPEIAKFLKYRD